MGNKYSVIVQKVSICGHWGSVGNLKPVLSFLRLYYDFLSLQAFPCLEWLLLFPPYSEILSNFQARFPHKGTLLSFSESLQWSLWITTACCLSLAIALGLLLLCQGHYFIHPLLPWYITKAMDLH